MKLLKSIRNANLFLKGSFMNKKNQFKIHHSAKNFVNIDLSDDNKNLWEDESEENPDIQNELL